MSCCTSSLPLGRCVSNGCTKTLNVSSVSSDAAPISKMRWSVRWYPLDKKLVSRSTVHPFLYRTGMLSCGVDEINPMFRRTNSFIYIVFKL